MYPLFIFLGTLEHYYCAFFLDADPKPSISATESVVPCKIDLLMQANAHESHLRRQLDISKSMLEFWKAFSTLSLYLLEEKKSGTVQDPDCNVGRCHAEQHNTSDVNKQVFQTLSKQAIQIQEKFDLLKKQSENDKEKIRCLQKKCDTSQLALSTARLRIKSLEDESFLSKQIPMRQHKGTDREKKLQVRLEFCSTLIA